MTLGYDRDLYMLAFDHRGSFQKQLLGISGTPTPEEVARISDTKSLIFEGFLLGEEVEDPNTAAKRFSVSSPQLEGAVTNSGFPGTRSSNRELTARGSSPATDHASSASVAGIEKRISTV